MEHCSLEQAINRHVRPGDSVHVVMGHHRWTAAARELARQHWGNRSGFELIMASLGSLGAAFFRGGMLRRVVTAYSGDAFPTYSPNPVFAGAYRAGEVEVEHWSFLSLAQRLEAAARGLPAIVTPSIGGSSMAENAGYAEVASPFGAVRLLAPLVPDVTLMHAAVSDREGNVAIAPPALEGVWGAFAARRGAVVTVERVVEDLRPWQHLVQLPAHRVLAVVEAPFGAHPGGMYAPGLPVTAYGEDIAFWIDARNAARADIDAWLSEWFLQPDTHERYLAQLGDDRLDRLRQRADPDSWRDDERAHPVDESVPVSDWERAAVWAARELGELIATERADAVLAGAGVANLAAWLGVERARTAGHPVHLTAELGLWGYTPTPADPFVFNHRSFPSATMVSDAQTVLGMFVGGPGTTTLGCVGAAQIDRSGNINSTMVPGGPFLVGSGGGNDVVTRAAQSLVVTLLRPVRTPEHVGYVTGPGSRVNRIVTDRGILRRSEAGSFHLTAIASGPGKVEDRIRDAVQSCGWSLETDRDIAELDPPHPSEIAALRRWDPMRLFLGG